MNNADWDRMFAEVVLRDAEWLAADCCDSERSRTFDRILVNDMDWGERPFFQCRMEGNDGGLNFDSEASEGWRDRMESYSKVEVLAHLNEAAERWHAGPADPIVLEANRPWWNRPAPLEWHNRE